MENRFNRRPRKIGGWSAFVKSRKRLSKLEADLVPEIVEDDAKVPALRVQHTT